jgi:ubiquinone/menaquinone biosynthesis C-methylase UbiE
MAESEHNLPPVLDACCGGRMMWFNPRDPRAVFVDCRCESIVTDTRPGRLPYTVQPDVVADFTALPFPDNHFSLVVFDPPHIVRRSADRMFGWITKKYGVLHGDWRAMLRQGFAECFRVLRPNGTLIFKWSESHVPLSEILQLTQEQPLFGHKSGKQAGTHWVAFLKS